MTFVKILMAFILENKIPASLDKRQIYCNMCISDLLIYFLKYI